MKHHQSNHKKILIENEMQGKDMKKTLRLHAGYGNDWVHVHFFSGKNMKKKRLWFFFHESEKTKGIASFSSAAIILQKLKKYR